MPIQQPIHASGSAVPLLQRVRIDRLLVERGLFESRAKAQAAIEAGLVEADDIPVTKASQEIALDAVLRAEVAHPWVSRAGVKLAAALDHFALDPHGRVCLDVGASTGGFSEVLLTRGAQRVYAIDVGRGQLHPHLRGRSELLSLEGTDIRELDPARLAEPPDFVVIDVSFISLKLVVPAALDLAARRADLLALVKPQFETGRRHLKKGVVRDPAVHAQVCAEVTALIRSLDCEVRLPFPSPIAGGDGNREFFLAAQRR